MPKKRKPMGSLRAGFGTAPRRRYAAIMEAVKASYGCPKCGFRKVKRGSVGIWICGKCGYTFAGGAYEPSTAMGETSKRSGRGPVKPEVPAPPRAEENQAKERQSPSL